MDRNVSIIYQGLTESDYISLSVDYFTATVSCAGLARKGLASKYPAGLDSEPELPDLMNEVAAEIPGKWRDVGLQLGVDQGVLGGIATINLGDTNLHYVW